VCFVIKWSIQYCAVICRLPSVISMDLWGNRSLLQLVQKVMSMGIGWLEHFNSLCLFLFFSHYFWWKPKTQSLIFITAGFEFQGLCVNNKRYSNYKLKRIYQTPKTQCVLVIFVSTFYSNCWIGHWPKKSRDNGYLAQYSWELHSELIPLLFPWSYIRRVQSHSQPDFVGQASGFLCHLDFELDAKIGK